MDYALPRADDFAAPVALVSAVLNALRPLGISDIEMPITPARLWSAIAAADRSGA